MPTTRFSPTLLIAFAGAVAVHAAVLPLVLLGMEGGDNEAPTDLRVSALSAPAAADAGEFVRLDATLHYQGSAPLDPTVLHRAWLSRDRTVDLADDHRVGLTDGRSAQAIGGGGFTLAVDFRLPADADGPYQLIFEADAERRLADDTDPANNTRATPIYIDGPQRPELAVREAGLPRQGIAGGGVLLTYTAANRGPGWASTPGGRGGWRDRVYLSADTTLDEHDPPLRTFARRSPLAPGDHYTHRRVAVDLPRVPPGRYHLILAADADQVLDQPSFSAGLYTGPIEIRDTGLPDLAVASAAAPARVPLDSPFAVQWSVANLGSVASDLTPGPGRHDAVYLSRDDTLDPADTLLSVGFEPQAVAAQSVLDAAPLTTTVPAQPQHPPGDWHLIVAADHGNAIDEGPFEHNNTFAIPITLTAPRDDDDELDLGEPDNDPLLTVAWIEHERVEEHMARLAETLQPAIQNLVDPDPRAPLVNDPKPPAPPAIALQAEGAGERPPNRPSLTHATAPGLGRLSPAPRSPSTSKGLTAAAATCPRPATANRTPHLKRPTARRSSPTRPTPAKAKPPTTTPRIPSPLKLITKAKTTTTPKTIPRSLPQTHPSLPKTTAISLRMTPPRPATPAKSRRPPAPRATTPRPTRPTPRPSVCALKKAASWSARACGSTPPASGGARRPPGSPPSRTTRRSGWCLIQRGGSSRPRSWAPAPATRTGTPCCSSPCTAGPPRARTSTPPTPTWSSNSGTSSGCSTAATRRSTGLPWAGRKILLPPVA